MKRVIEVEGVTQKHAFAEAILNSFSKEDYRDETLKEFQSILEKIVDNDDEDVMDNYIDEWTMYAKCEQCGWYFDTDEGIYNTDSLLCILCEIENR
jgi:formylmethanofuran dehydrogenase subunit E